MKAFQFPLERVLRLKQQQEKLAELQQQQAQSVLDAARSEIELLQTRLLETTQGVEVSRVGGAFALGTWTARWDHAAVLTRALEEATLKEQELDRLFQEARAARTQLAVAVETLLTLRRRHWADHRQANSHEQQSQLDDLGLERWLQSRETRETGRSGMEGGVVP